MPRCSCALTILKRAGAWCSRFSMPGRRVDASWSPTQRAARVRMRQTNCWPVADGVGMASSEGGRTDQPVPGVIALLVADVDGTLVTNDKQLTAPTVEAVRSLSEAGIAFAITSSRPPMGLRTPIASLAITTPVGAFNGGLIVSPENLEPIEGNALPADIARRAIAFLAHRRIGIWFQTDREWLLLDRDGPYVDLEIRT